MECGLRHDLDQGARSVGSRALTLVGVGAQSLRDQRIHWTVTISVCAVHTPVRFIVPNPSINPDLSSRFAITEILFGEWLECLQAAIKWAGIYHINRWFDFGKILCKLFRLLDAFGSQGRIRWYSSPRLNK